MPSDVERIAEVLANHPDWHADAGDLEVVMCRLCSWRRRVLLDSDAESEFRTHQAEQLAAAGIGHVPTALHQAADAWQHGEWANAPRRADRIEERIANGRHVGEWLRARADREGES